MKATGLLFCVALSFCILDARGYGQKYQEQWKQSTSVGDSSSQESNQQTTAHKTLKPLAPRSSEDSKNSQEQQNNSGENQSKYEPRRTQKSMESLEDLHKTESILQVNKPYFSMSKYQPSSSEDNADPAKRQPKIVISKHYPQQSDSRRTQKSMESLEEPQKTESIFQANKNSFSIYKYQPRSAEDNADLAKRQPKIVISKNYPQQSDSRRTQKSMESIEDPYKTERIFQVNKPYFSMSKYQQRSAEDNSDPAKRQSKIVISKNYPQQSDSMAYPRYAIPKYSSLHISKKYYPKTANSDESHESPRYIYQEVVKPYQTGYKRTKFSISDNSGSSEEQSVHYMKSVPSHITEQKYSNVDQYDMEKIYEEAYKNMPYVSTKFMKAYENVYENNNEIARHVSNATELLKKNKYTAEEHTVVTDDGYILTIIRVPGSPKAGDNINNKPVVFLMHGLLGSADDWLLMGPDNSLAYLLADAGYDVWLGNARGNRYSRRHVAIHPALPEFWQYSNDQIALHDLPAMIDYVLKTSQQKKMAYVGFSQGNADFFALASIRPEYNDKINMMYAVSPVAYMTNTRSAVLKSLAPNSPIYRRLDKQDGRFFLTKKELRAAGGSVFEEKVGLKGLSQNINFVMSGLNPVNLDPILASEIVKHVPTGGSARQMKHVGQAAASQDFKMYDYGSEINKMVYGSKQPMKYNLSNVKAPVTIILSEDDWLASPTDVERLRNELPNLKDAVVVPGPYYTNLDLLYGNDTPKILYKELIKSLDKKTKDSKESY